MKQLVFYTFLLFQVLFIPRVFSQNSSGRYPKNNSVLSNPNIQFVVNEVPHFVNNRVQIATVSDFSSVFLDTVFSGLSMNYSLPTTSNISYFWRTKSYVIGDSTEWSPVLNFDVFDPSLENNVVLWLSAKNINLTSGSALNTWMDKSSFGYNATQSNASLQPVFMASGGFRNEPYVDFVGSDGMSTSLTNSVILNDSVLGFVSLTSNRNQGFGALFYLGNSGNLTPSFAARTSGSSYNNGAMRFLGYNGSTFTFDLQTPNNTFKIVSGINSKFNAKLFSGGLLVSNSTAGLVPVNAAATLKIGCNQDFTENYSGRIHELIVLKNNSDQTVYRKLERFVDNHYVPRVDLGGNRFRYSGLCDSAVTLAAGSGYSEYLWSTGETTSNIIINDFGLYSVTVKDELGFIHTDQIEYKPYFFLKYPKKSNICLGDSILWNSGVTNSYNVVWSDGVIGQSRYVKIGGNLSFKVIDGNLCEYFSDTLTFIIDNYSQTTTLGNDTTLCAGNFIELKNNQAETVSYLWSDNSSSSSLEINTTGFYRVTTTNINGCVAKDTIHVSISGLAPNAQFASQNVCLGSNSFFADQSTSTSPDVIELWQWDFGDGNVSSDQNPTYVYSNIGVYDVQLYIETNVGCGAFANASVEVLKNPEAGFTVAGFCSLDNIKFTDASSNGGATIDNWSWDFGQPSSGSGNSSDLASPTKTFNEKGIFTVRLTVEDENSCTSFIQKNLDVKASPQTSFSFSDTCAGLTVKLLNETTIQSPAVVTNYLWTFGDGNISLQSNPSKSYSTFGKYEAILKATSNEGCIFSDTNEIEVFPIPVASMEIGPVCKSAITEFIDNSTIAEGSIASSKWYINLNDSIMGTPASYVFNDFGQQQVVLKTTSDKGCFKLKSALLTITDELSANFSTSSNIVAVNEPVTFTENAVGATEYKWNFGDGGISIEANPSHIFSSEYADSLVRILLEAKNDIGCRDTISKTISVRPYLFDLELKRVLLSEDKGQVIIGVELKNNGNSRIAKADLEVNLPAIGSAYSETWSGSIEPGKSILHVLQTKLTKAALTNLITQEFICIEAVGYDANGTIEKSIQNNRLCEVLTTEDPVLTLISPNPTFNLLNFDLILSKDELVSLEIVDSKGNIVSTLMIEETLVKGFYPKSYDISLMEGGVYFLNLTTSDTKISQRFTKQ